MKNDYKSYFKVPHFRVDNYNESIVHFISQIGAMQYILIKLGKEDQIALCVSNPFSIFENGKQVLFDSYFNRFLSELNKQYGTQFDYNHSFSDMGVGMIVDKESEVKTILEKFKELSGESKETQKNLSDASNDYTASGIISKEVKEDRKAGRLGIGSRPTGVQHRTDVESLVWEDMKPPKMGRQKVLDLASEFGVELEYTEKTKVKELVSQFKSKLLGE